MFWYTYGSSGVTISWSAPFVEAVWTSLLSLKGASTRLPHPIAIQDPSLNGRWFPHGVVIRICVRLCGGVDLWLDCSKFPSSFVSVDSAGIRYVLTNLNGWSIWASVTVSDGGLLFHWKIHRRQWWWTTGEEPRIWFAAARLLAFELHVSDVDTKVKSKPNVYHGGIHNCCCCQPAESTIEGCWRFGVKSGHSVNPTRLPTLPGGMWFQISENWHLTW